MLVLFLLPLPVRNATCYNLLFHLLLILLIVDNLLLRFVFLLQIFHLTHLFDILRYLSHLVLLIHNYLHFLFLVMGILLLNKMVYQNAYQSEPMLELEKSVLHMTILLNCLHYSIMLFFYLMLKSDQHQRLHLHNVATIYTQLNTLCKR